MIYIRNLCIVIAIIIILSSLVLSEQLLIRKFCHDISDILVSAEKILSQGNIPRDGVSLAVKMWEKKKAAVFIFSNHSNFHEIENNIYKLEFYTDKGDSRQAELCIDTLRHRVHELKESCLFRKENIL